MSTREEDNSLFEAIIQGLRDEKRDPIFDDVMTQVVQAEIALNRAGGTIDHATRQSVLETLNTALENAQLLGRPVRVTGRLRIAEGIIDDDDDREEMVAVALGDMGTEQRDESGAYFAVYDEMYLCGSFELESKDTTDYTGNPMQHHRVILNLTPESEGDDASGWLVAYPDDLSEFAPDEPSHLKVEHELAEKYPELREQLDELPSDCGKDKKILRALHKFALEIDWSQYPHLPQQDRLQLLDFCERYITKRINLDTTQYRFLLKGMIVGVDGNERFIEEIEKPRELNARIGHVRLLETAAADDSESRVYLPMLETFAPSEERGTGDEIVYIPVLSIVGFENTRNKRLFSRETTIYSPLDQAVEVPENTASEVEPLVFETKQPANRQEELTQLEANFTKLLEVIDEVKNRAFSSLEEAREVRDGLDEVIRKFYETMPKERILFEADGPGVLYMPLEMSVGVDDEEDEMTIELSNLVLAEGDIFSPQRGYFTGRTQTGIGPIEGNESLFGIDVQMLFAAEYSGGSLPVYHEEIPGVPVYMLTPSKLFVVKPNLDTHIVIPELERLRKCNTAIGRVATQLPDLIFLPVYLDELRQEIESETSEFIDADVERLNEIGIMVGGDERGSDLVGDALAEIIGQRGVAIVGPAYDDTGKLILSGETHGQIEGIVTTQPTINVEEPMLAVVQPDGAKRFVPLSTIERFQF